MTVKHICQTVQQAAQWEPAINQAPSQSEKEPKLHPRPTIAQRLPRWIKLNWIEFPIYFAGWFKRRAILFWVSFKLNTFGLQIRLRQRWPGAAELCSVPERTVSWKYMPLGWEKTHLWKPRGSPGQKDELFISPLVRISVFNSHLQVRPPLFRSMQQEIKEKCPEGNTAGPSLQHVTFQGRASTAQHGAGVWIIWIIRAVNLRLM